MCNNKWWIFIYYRSTSIRKTNTSIPVKKQFEQILNAIYLDKLGYGEHHSKINQAILDNFIEKIPVYKKNISEKYVKPKNNNETLNILKETIEEVINN